MAESHDSVENHSNNLDEHNKGKEDHESDTNRLQLQVLILNLNQNITKLVAKLLYNYKFPSVRLSGFGGNAIFRPQIELERRYLWMFHPCFIYSCIIYLKNYDEMLVYCVKCH